MSAPVTNKQHSWVGSEDAQGRGQYHYYNPNLAAPGNNDWQQGYNPVQPQVNQGAADWSYPQQHQHSQGYSHQYQQSNSQLVQQYPAYQGHSNVRATNETSDPWNWGWDESSNTETANNNAKPDPTWDWSVEGSTSYQEPVGSAHYMQQHQEPIGTSSNYIHNVQEPVGANNYTQHNQKCTWNTPPHVFSSDSTGQDNVSGYSNTQQASLHFVNAQQIPSTQAVIEDSFSTASVVNQNTFEHQQNIFQTVGKTHQHLNLFSCGNNVHLLNNNQAEDHSFMDHSLKTNKTDVNQMSSDSQQETSIRTNNIKPQIEHDQRGSCEKQLESPMSAKLDRAAAVGDTMADIVADVTMERKFGTNEVLPSQWSTESLPSQGSDEISQAMDGGQHSDITSPALTISQSPLDTEGSSLSDSQFNQGYQYNFKLDQAVGDVLQQMPQAENLSTGSRKQDLQQGNAPEVLSAYGVESKSIKPQYILQTISQASNSCDQTSVENSTPLGLVQSGYICNDMYKELKSTQNEYLSSTSGASSLHSVDNISSDLKSMTLSSNANSSSADVENVEIVPPEHDHPGGMFSRPGHASSGTPPPSMVATTPSTGPPKSTGNSVGMNSNPYASGKSTLNHKYSGNKRRSQPSNGDGSVDSIPSTLNLTQSDPNCGSNMSSVSQFGSSEIMPLYSSSGMGDVSGGFGSRSKINLMPTAEDAVNLETVPDNKERPDFMDLQQPVLLERKVTRLHAGPVGQDLVRTPPGLWSQQSEHSASPENLEVAPRCGPDRNQYLETGQLTEAPGRMPDVLDSLQCRPPPGLRRMVPGQMTEEPDTLQAASTTPPPGLHRMVPGQLTESESGPVQDGSASGLHQSSSGDDVPLHRMVPGRLTEDEPTSGSVPDDGNDGMVPAGNSVDEIPPPGLRRMVPGESSSPESQGTGGAMLTQGESFQTIDSVPMEPRVVTGVARDEVDGGSGQITGLQLAPSPMQLSSSSCVASEPESPSSETNMTSNNLPQPTSERSETIGSDSVETYAPPSIDNSPRDLSNRRDTSNKERERRHRDDQDMEERTVSGPHRRRDYYGPRDQDESPGTGTRYQDDRERRPYDRDRELDESPSGGRYRDERDRRRYDSRQDYSRRTHEEDQRSRHRRAQFDCPDPDADAEGYFSDRERDRARDRDRDHPRDRDLDRDRDRREKSSYEYEQRYRERGSEKGGRDRQDHRTQGRDRHRDRDRYDRRRQEYPQDYRRGDEYYGRGYEDDPYYRDQRSRPSSRSGSRPEYDDDRRRDYHTYGGYNIYGRPTMDLYHYQYYMAAWQRYLHQGSCPDDRGSVHSGRSSANEERGVEEQSNSLLEEGVTTTPQRLTPAKFSTAHIKGFQTAQGQLVKILPHYPLDGQSATVEIHKIQSLIVCDDTSRELVDFPGPLVKGVTHKKSLMAFCMRKIKSAERDLSLWDRESVVLLWKLLVLLLRQNGTVVGTDISELLLLSSPGHEGTGSILAPSPAISQHSVSDVREATTEEHQPAVPTNTEEEVTNKFRECLLYGNTKEALEWAMKHGLWGHALFLASKMDQRTYAHVMMRFANGLTLNDPLQTLYQLMSGRLPACVTCCADERWGDWKPHLAMILSNSTQRPDLDHRAITTLGDTLATRGCLHAAHFCYLMAQLEFGSYNIKSSKMVLLGSSHTKPFLEFANNEAIQMTELYVYSCQLADPDFELPQFQNYKFLYAMRLAEVGLPAEALQYVEVITRTVLRRPATYNLEFVQQLYEMGNKLKYHDPVYNAGDQYEVEQELPWLVQCRNVINDYLSGVVQPDGRSYGSTSNLSYSEGDLTQSQLPAGDHVHHTQDAQQYDSSWQRQQPVYFPDRETQQWLPQQPLTESLPVEGYQPQLDATDTSQQAGAEQPSYWTPQQWGGGQDSAQPASAEAEESQHHQSTSRSTGAFNYWDMSANHQEGSPQVTLAGSLSADTAGPSPVQTASESKAPAKSKSKKEPSKPAARSSWFGGIWNKLALKPKNQMILPDDKNPSIVWDPDKKRWTNVDGEEDASVANLPPPPKASDLAGSNNTLSPAPDMGNGTENRVPLPPLGQNIYKMSRGRSLRANYVDVLGGSKASQPVVPAPDLFPTMGAIHTATPNFFIPAPVDVNDTAPTDFLTPASVASEAQEPTSGESSQGGGASDGAPMMFNPSSFSQPAAAAKYTGTLNRKRYPN